MMAPIIPSLTSHEILPLSKAVADAGATRIAYTIVRLNGQLAQIFTQWLEATMPDKAQKILNQIAECHGGTLNDSRTGTRMKGEGPIAQQINDLIRLAKSRYFRDLPRQELRTDLFKNPLENQLTLFR
jgi:DNA repair photolyase